MRVGDRTRKGSASLFLLPSCARGRGGALLGPRERERRAEEGGRHPASTSFCEVGVEVMAPPSCRRLCCLLLHSTASASTVPIAQRFALHAATFAYPDTPKPCNELGAILLADGRTRAALRHYETALARSASPHDDDGFRHVDESELLAQPPPLTHTTAASAPAPHRVPSPTAASVAGGEGAQSAEAAAAATAAAAAAAQRVAAQRAAALGPPVLQHSGRKVQ